MKIGLGVLGALVGAVVGYFLFNFMVRQGFYAIAMPGAIVGLLCGYLSGTKSFALAIICSIIALFLGLFLEWMFRPFLADGGFLYFLSHVHQLKPVTIGMILLGTLFGGWFGLGRERFSRQRTSRETDGMDSGAV